MVKHALKLSSREDSGVSQLARSMATGLAGHPGHVATPAVTPTQLNTGADNLDAAVQLLVDHDEARDGLVQGIANARGTLEALLIKSADDSAVQTSYDKTKMEELLIPLQSEGGTADTSPLQNVHVSHGDHDGEVDGGCNRRKNAKLYRARCGLTATGPWTIVYEGSRSTFTVTGQPSGQICYFQMQAYVGGEWTEWSDIAQIRVL